MELHAHPVLGHKNKFVVTEEEAYFIACASGRDIPWFVDILECISKPCGRQEGREQGRADLSKYSPILGVFRSAQAPGVAVLKCALSRGLRSA